MNNKSKKLLNMTNLLEYSTRLHLLLSEAKQLNEDMTELRDKITYFGASSVLHGTKNNATGRDRFADFMVDVENLESTMLENIHKIIRERQKLERAIGKIDDDEARLLLRLRLINGLSWEKIGNTLNTDRTNASRKFRKILGG